MIYPRWYRRIFALLFFAGGGFFFLWAVASMLIGLTAFAWPSTTASVSESSVEKHNAPKGGTSYERQVSYAYAIGTEHFIGHRLQFGYMGSSFENTSESIVKGSSLRIRYLSYFPAVSTIKPGFNLLAFVPLAAGLFFILLAYSINHDSA